MKYPTKWVSNKRRKVRVKMQNETIAYKNIKTCKNFALAFHSLYFYQLKFYFSFFFTSFLNHLLYIVFN